MKSLTQVLNEALNEANNEAISTKKINENATQVSGTDIVQDQNDFDELVKILENM